MAAEPPAPELKASGALSRVRAALVHLYTASGVLLAFLAVLEVCADAPDVRRTFLLLALAVLVDATDGPLARRWEIRRRLPAIDGRIIDDIVDYLTYTFVPLLLVWRMGWVPDPALLWVGPALVASLFGFANVGAKDEGGGFFLGFPSYWNVVAFYAGIADRWIGPWLNAVAIVLLALLTVLPVRFIYPNLAPPPWRVPLIAGAVAWLGVMLWLLADYPAGPGWLIAVSLVYPLGYVLLSFRLAAGRPGPTTP